MADRRVRVGLARLVYFVRRPFRLSDLLEKAPYKIDGVAKGGILAIPLLFLVITAYLTGRKIKTTAA